MYKEHGCRCQLCKLGARTRSRKRYQRFLDAKARIDPDHPIRARPIHQMQHGEQRMYTRGKCRCDVCCTAIKIVWRERYDRALTRKGKIKRIGVDTPREHGQVRMYRKDKCRCDRCVAAIKKYWKERESIRTAKAKAHRRELTRLRRRLPENLKKIGNTKQARKEYVDALKRQPCTDCGQIFPTCAMHFDHLDPATKKKSVSGLVNGAMQTLLAEIKKCELVCANCHAIRTFILRKHRSTESQKLIDADLKFHMVYHFTSKNFSNDNRSDSASSHTEI